jgi:hypothetical protein
MATPMSVSTTTGFVPEAVIVFVLKHSSAFDWLCINCQCRAEFQDGACGTEGGKWQRAQGENGLDVVGRLATPRHRWFSGLDAARTTVILEAKGDRLQPGGVKINRPAYNEMTGALSAFFLSNLKRIREQADRVYGWLVPTTFHDRVIEDFREAMANLPLALPPGRAFLIGTFDGPRFWRDATPELHGLARDWFTGKQAARNALCHGRLGCQVAGVRELAEDLFRFEVVSGG